ncbi:MAG: LCP family protein [Bacilli bacterium]|nr:LCP family protein [Bacilli bacterium]
MKNKKIKLSIPGFILGILLLVLTFSLIILINKLGMVPDNYFTLIIVILLIITILTNLLLIIKFKNKFLKIIRIIIYILTCILIITYIVGLLYLNKTINLFDNVSEIKEEVTDYYLIVLNESNYQEPSDLYEKKLGYYETTDEEVITSIKLNLEYYITSDMNELKDKLFNQEIDAILISDIIKNKYEEDDENFNNNIRILKTISITKEIEDITKRVSIKNTPYNILISGIDAYGDINKTSRNDVNIIATVNPNTNEILLTSIPRDYYVQLHGTSGYKDKLTHASYYGINTVIETIEDLLDTDINYYVKVNFTTVIDLVDKLNGIDVYADQTVMLSGCPVYQGMNNLNGKCALAFSRERYSYIDGDRHRGRNQQEVIKAIFMKITSGTTILTKYTDIIDVLDGKFATNMDMNEITNFLKFELNELPKYQINSIQVDGYGSMGPTYSYPGQDLWIMIPYEETVNNAKTQINELLNK